MGGFLVIARLSKNPKIKGALLGLIRIGQGLSSYQTKEGHSPSFDRVPFCYLEMAIYITVTLAAAGPF